MQTNTKFMQFVDTPYTVKYTAAGEAYVNFPGGYIVSIDGYSKVCIEVLGTTITKSFSLNMGKISGSTLADAVALNQAADAHIHTYPVIGPEAALLLKGTPNTTDKVQLWVYLIP
jgi:hypothetical protein